MAKVSKRGGFSDRNNIKAENKMIQLKDFDQRTRIQLQNMLNRLYKKVYGDIYYGKPYIQNFFRYVLGDIYSEYADVRELYDDDVIWNMINSTIMDDVLTLLEAIVQYWDAYKRRNDGVHYYNPVTERYQTTSIYELANDCFKSEYIGYRFVDGFITPISDEIELQSVNEALGIKYKAVSEHIAKANRLLADRSNPDYENSIKESISSVEAMCEILIGASGSEAALGKMLKKLENNGVEIHSALKSAFCVLYGYTSDANGIRHAGDIGGPSSTFDEAKFMLVSCSAFVNYLIGVTSD